MSPSTPPDSVMVAGAPSGEIMFSNLYAERVVGRRLADLAEDFPMFHLDGRPYAVEERQVTRSLSSGEEIVDEEFLGPGANDDRLRYSVSCWPVYDHGGQVVAAVAVTRDVTQEKRREERLTYLAGLLDHTEDAVVALDAQWFVTVWNAGAERMYGWTADEVLGRHTLDVARLEMSDEQRAEVRLTVAKRGLWRGEVIAYRKDGAPVWVELITVALQDARGEITGYLGIHRDISKRKEAEEALRESQRRSETILESITDEFVAVDREWRYTYVNERALRRMESRSGGGKLTQKDILGRRMWELFPDMQGTTIEQKCREAMHERRVVQFEAYFAPSDEWIEAHAYPSEDGLAIYYREVSDRKRAEEDRENRARQQALVAELGRRALSTDDVQELFDEAVVLVARTLAVEFAGIVEEAPRGDALTFGAGFGSRDGAVGQQLDWASLAGYTLRSRAPVIVADIATDPRFDPSEIAEAHGIVSALSVMIESPDEPFGVLGVLSTQRREFSESDVSFVQAVANVLAGAVERRWAERRLSEVREAERRRIARNLHDEALQDLTEAVIQAARGRTAGLDGDAAGALASSLEGVSRQLRSAIYDLRLSDDEESRPFGERLRALVEVHRALAADSTITLEVEATAGPLGDRGTDVLRIVGEALTNVRRHAGARNVRVSASGSGARLLVEVSDDGSGFDTGNESARVDRMGIAGMRERAALLDADLDIASAPPTGTTMRLQLGHGEDRVARTGVARILLVEDNTALREAIAGMFAREPDLEVVGQAASLAEARPMLSDVDVAVIDLGLPDGYGGDLIRELHDANPRAQAVALGAGLEPAEIVRAMDCGAGSAVNKTAAFDQLVGAVRRLHGDALSAGNRARRRAVREGGRDVIRAVAPAPARRA